MTDETVLFVYNSYVDLEIISILSGMRESAADPFFRSNRNFQLLLRFSQFMDTEWRCSRMPDGSSAHISDYKLSFARKPSRQSATG